MFKDDNEDYKLSGDAGMIEVNIWTSLDSIIVNLLSQTHETVQRYHVKQASNRKLSHRVRRSRIALRFYGQSQESVRSRNS